MSINVENTRRRKFQWKFNKGLFRRPINRIPIWVLLKEQEKNWRGTLLAVFTIGLISGIIILAALFVTSHEKKIHYNRFTIDELLWVSEQNRDPTYFWHQNSFIYVNPNGTWSRLDLDNGAPVKTFAEALKITRPMDLGIADLQKVSGLCPNNKETAWLVRYGETKISLQDTGYYYMIVLLDKTRINVNPLGTSEDPILLHYASWSKNEFSLTVQMDNNLYSTENILQKTNKRGFKCLTCHLPMGWIYGYPGWIYRQYFKYDNDGAYWWRYGPASDRLLILATDQSHLERVNISVYSDSRHALQSTQRSIIYQPFYSKLEDHPKSPEVNLFVIEFPSNKLFNLSWTQLAQSIGPLLAKNPVQNTSSRFFLTRIQWFNETGFLIRGVTESQNCGFILFCTVKQDNLQIPCEHVWHHCASRMWLDMRKHPNEKDLLPVDSSSFLTILPFSTELITTHQLAIVQLIPGQKNRIRWLTEHAFHVQEILFANNQTILFSGTAQSVNRHLYQYNRFTDVMLCLTCNELNDSMLEGSLSHLYAQVYKTTAVQISRQAMQKGFVNESAHTLTQVAVSANGLYFTSQWSTGYEPFGASATKEAPTRQLINHLTGNIINASEYETTEFVEAYRMDPDAGVTVWYIEPEEHANTSSIQIYLIWHSHLLLFHRWDSNTTTLVDADGKPHIRSKRHVDTQITKSAKQHQAPTSTYRMKVKEKFLNATQSPLYLLHPSPPFGDRPVANVVMRFISFGPSKKTDTAPVSRHSTPPVIAAEHPINLDAVGSGALVRFWFPPYLNERHLKAYPLLVNVKSTLERTSSNVDRLLEELILYLSGSLDVIVLQVLNWVGDADLHARAEGIAGQIENYHSLLRSLNDNYHYIERNRTALMGSPGLPSHLAGLLLGSYKAALNPSCGVLLAPVSRWSMHEYVEAVRLFGAQEDQKYYEFDLTKMAERYRNKELLIVHGSADSVVPFAQTMKLVAALVQENVDVNLYPLFDEDQAHLNRHIQRAVLTKLATFLYDCLRRTPDQHSHFATKTATHEPKESGM